MSSPNAPSNKNAAEPAAAGRRPPVTRDSIGDPVMTARQVNVHYGG
jgi:hypothetical protein